MTRAHTYDYHLCRLRLTGADGLPAPIEVPGTTRRIALPHATVRVNLAGSGSHTILLTPDPPHTLEMYAGVIRTLSARFRVITFELPGFGFSRPARTYGFQLSDTVQVMRDLLDAMDSPRVVLAMPCGAGYAALRFAQLYGDRVTGLVSVQTPEFREYHQWIQRVDANGELRRPLDGQRHLARDAETISRNWLRMAENDRPTQANYIEQNARNIHAGSCFCLASALQGLADSENYFADWKLHVPAAVLWGAGDKTYRHTQSFTFQMYLPSQSRAVVNAGPTERPEHHEHHTHLATQEDPRMIALPKVGHFPEMSRPDLLLQLVESVVAAS